MNLKELRELIQEILRSDIREFELEQTGTKVRLLRGLGLAAPNIEVPTTPPAPTGTALPAPTAMAAAPEPSPTEQPILEDELHMIASPIVGTFYRAPSPGSEPYVKIGDAVEEGQILCVVEAMKLMNEIPSDVSGEVVRIYVENAYPVEYGQKLFGIRSPK